MFFVIFGFLWTSVTCIILMAFYGGGNNVYVNGVLVTQEEFNQMIEPKIFFAIFLLIGVACLVFGLRRVIKNELTSRKGIECFGKILEIYPTNIIINGVPEYKATVVIDVDGRTQIVSEILTALESTYQEGDYVRVKYYNNDINFEERILNSEVIPSNIKESFEDKAKLFFEQDNIDIKTQEITDEKL